MEKPRLGAVLVVALLFGGAWSAVPAWAGTADPFEGQVVVDKQADSGQSPGAAPTAGKPVIPVNAPVVKKAAGGTYTVVRGDCLWNIAKRFLGDGSRYWDIVEANKARYPSLAKNPNLIYPGWVLTIPGTSGSLSPGSAAKPSGPSKPSTASPITPNPNVPAPAAGAKGPKALYTWLQRAGLSGEKLRIAWAIGMGESGGNPRAYNGNSRTGDKSYGLFQINMIGSLGPARLKQYNLKSYEDLFDPETNIRVMIKMSNNCTNWQPWSVYKRGTYKKFLSLYPPR